MKKKKDKWKWVRRIGLVLFAFAAFYVLFIVDWPIPDSYIKHLNARAEERQRYREANPLPRTYPNLECSNNWYEDNYCWNETNYCEAIRITWDEPYVLGACYKK